MRTGSAAILWTLVIVGAVAGLATGCRSTTTTTAAPPDRGAALFARHCAACHGERGAADTPIAALMAPRPRAFADGVFKLVSTENGVPTVADLERTIRRGMPGSVMPGYEWLPADDVAALAQHVRAIAIAGVAERVQRTARALGRTMTDADAHATAERRLRPGAEVAVPTTTADPDVRSGLGHLLYQQHCAACHGADGRGRQAAYDWAGAGEFAWARDFTVGFLRAEPSATGLAHRIRAGMPGAHMPPTRLSDEETTALIGYVQSLIPDGADRQHVQWRHHLRVPRHERIPAATDEAAWQAIEAVRLPLAPLRWRIEAVFEATVRVAHDGQRVALQVSWADDSRDDRLGTATQGDGIALQFTAATDPPLFAMGGSDPVHMWHWRSFHAQDVAGALDLLTGRSDLDVGNAIPGLTGPTPHSEALAVHGPQDMHQRRGSGTDVPVVPVWRDGRWTITMTRALAARSGDEIDLRPGSAVLMALAIWNGAIDDQPWSKSVTTWHRLELLP